METTCYVTTTEKITTQVCCRQVTLFFCVSYPWGNYFVVATCYVTRAYLSEENNHPSLQIYSIVCYII